MAAKIPLPYFLWDTSQITFLAEPIILLVNPEHNRLCLCLNLGSTMQNFGFLLELVFIPVSFCLEADVASSLYNNFSLYFTRDKFVVAPFI